MKNVFACLIACILAFSFGGVYATSLDDFSGETIYLEDYDQYKELLGSVNYQEEYKQDYNKMVADDINNYNNAVRDKVYRAEVLEALDVEVEYGMHPYYQYYYKSSYQPLKVRILDDGEYKGKEFEFAYVLTCDTYGNVQLRTVQKGDVVNVTIYSDEGGNAACNIASYDAPRERWQAVLVLIIIAVLFAMIYTGKHCAKLLVPAVLVIDLLFFVFMPSLIEGASIIFMTSIILILSTIVICVLKLGIKSETFVAMFSTLLICALLLLLVYCFDAVAGLCGITYDASYIMEYVMPVLVDGEVESVVNFHNLSVGITVLIIYFGVVTMCVETAKLYANKAKSKNKMEEIADEMKEPLAEKMLLVFGILIVPLVSKLLLLTLNKCSMIELVNSEVLATEVARIAFALIGMSLAVPITTMLSRLSEE